MKVLDLLISMLSPNTMSERSKNHVIGNGNYWTETRQVPNFNKINAAGSIDVQIKMGAKEYGITVLADENVLPMITTEIEGDSLVISSKGSYATKNPTKVVVTATHLCEIIASGSADVHVTEIKQPEISLISSGSGDITATGVAEAARLRCSGSGDLQCISLKATNLDAKVSGSGSVSATATTSATLKATGSGNLQVWGKPTEVHSTHKGSGNIRLR